MHYKSLLVQVFGWRAALIHGGPTTVDRWIWLTRRLPRIDQPLDLIDIGCGTGAFTTGLALRGYRTLGLSWDERDQKMARERAAMSGAKNASFDVLDVRRLDARPDLQDRFDVAICCEVIEHILDDAKLLRDAAGCLKPGGRLLLTTPNAAYRPITPEDAGPFPPVETGWHVRKGYTPDDLTRLCQQSGLELQAISYCSGFVSQKTTYVFRTASRAIHPLVGWTLSLPLRLLPPLLDAPVTRALRWPEYSICLEARKPAEQRLS
jgi:2-polyprenyl-3-methyl-5-hydroxy-6-metoxy-1,4-benzoquinol methylase